MRCYIALIRKDADSDFGVSFPDLPGCVTAGRDLAEARDMAEEALALHLEGLAGEGEALPAPSDLDRVMADPENRKGLLFPVPVPEKRRLAPIHPNSPCLTVPAKAPLIRLPDSIP